MVIGFGFDICKKLLTGDLQDQVLNANACAGASDLREKGTLPRSSIQ